MHITKVVASILMNIENQQRCDEVYSTFDKCTTTVPAVEKINGEYNEGGQLGGNGSKAGAVMTLMVNPIGMTAVISKVKTHHQIEGVTLHVCRS